MVTLFILLLHPKLLRGHRLCKPVSLPAPSLSKYLKDLIKFIGKMENGKWKMQNGIWRMENRECKSVRGEKGKGKMAPSLRVSTLTTANYYHTHTSH